MFNIITALGIMLAGVVLGGVLGFLLAAKVYSEDVDLMRKSRDHWLEMNQRLRDQIGRQV